MPVIYILNEQKKNKQTMFETDERKANVFHHKMSV